MMMSASMAFVLLLVANRQTPPRRGLDEPAQKKSARDRLRARWNDSARR